MRNIIFFSAIIMATLLSMNTYAQEMPLVYDVENTGENCPEPYYLTIGQLPNVEPLPDPFLWSDGRGRISNFSDWKCRRAEIASEIQHYEIGEKPAPPENITASFDTTNNQLTVNVTVNGQTLTLTSVINLPEGEGPFPAIIGMGGTSMPDSLFVNRDIAQMNFNFGQVMAHTQNRGSEPINDLYPELEYMGAYSAWPWGVSRIIDGLELVSEEAGIDTEHLGVSGCSFAGKMALFSGAFDERIALTFAIESGGGGYTTWRFSETLGDVETLGRTNYAWFINALSDYSNDVDKLPFDHHELMAMVAPRALFVTGNPGWTWLADESGYVGSNATKKVYEALGISDRFAYSLIGGHNHCAIPGEQVPEITAFLDKFLLGEENVNTEVTTAPYNTNLSPWIPWEAPVLANDTSYFGKTVTTFPTDGATDVETGLTFNWMELEGADKYYIEVSENAAFTKIVKEDSTTNNSVSLDGLSEGTKYFWRIQVKNTTGLSGPWSNISSFVTSIPMPLKPQLLDALPFEGRNGYVTFNWASLENTSQYLLQLSEEPDFSSIHVSSTISDTAELITNIDEAVQYYWRVRGSNIAGPGPWTDARKYVLIMPPTELELQYRGNDKITLKWEDNSDVEDGYIIERLSNDADDFVVIDSLEGSNDEYEDLNIDEMEGNYTYRVKSYKDTVESVYSNEANMVFTDSETEEEMPQEFTLLQNYPNPFNPTTQIIFNLPKSSHVKLEVFNSMGQKVSSLVNRRMNSGSHNVTFDATNLPSGVYMYRIDAGEVSMTKKMLLIK